MKSKVGLWIDHRQAVIVMATDSGEEIRTILSQVEKQLRRTGSRPLEGNFDPQHVPSDDRQSRTFKAELNRFYDEVISAIGNAGAILIFGPGVAKNELKKRLAEEGLGDCISGIETADVMTKPQIAAKVREYFVG